MKTNKREDFFKRLRLIRIAYETEKDLQGEAFSPPIVEEEGGMEQIEELIKTRLPKKSIERVKKHGTTAEKMAYYYANRELKEQIGKEILTPEEEEAFLYNHAEGKALRMRDKLVFCYMSLQKMGRYILSSHKTNQVYTERLLLFVNRLESWLNEWRQREAILFAVREEIFKEGRPKEDFIKIMKEVDKKEKTLTDLSEGVKLWKIILALSETLSCTKSTFKTYLTAIDEFLAENGLDRKFLPYAMKVCVQQEEEEKELDFGNLPRVYRKSYINDRKAAGEKISQEEEAIAVFPDLREVPIKEKLYNITKDFLRPE